MLKNRFRWGDPMAHLVKHKDTDFLLGDIGDDEHNKGSGFIVPQNIPTHSWLKHGVDPALNRYGIIHGRQWDGLNQINGPTVSNAKYSSLGGGIHSFCSQLCVYRGTFGLLTSSVYPKERFQCYLLWLCRSDLLALCSDHWHCS